jgi:inhibitor of cysteine peptidase
VRRAAIALLSVLLLVGCGGEPPDTVELTADDSGSAIDLAPDGALTVTLESNETTGFSWDVVTEPDEAVLRVTSHEYVAPEDGLVGQGGVDLWTFTGVSPGSTSFQLAYCRPFDREDVQDTFELEVNVK